jgi:hypothetical protein
MPGEALTGGVSEGTPEVDVARETDCFSLLAKASTAGELAVASGAVREADVERCCK